MYEFPCKNDKEKSQKDNRFQLTLSSYHPIQFFVVVVVSLFALLFMRPALHSLRTQTMLCLLVIVVTY